MCKTRIADCISYEVNTALFINCSDFTEFKRKVEWDTSNLFPFLVDDAECTVRKMENEIKDLNGQPFAKGKRYRFSYQPHKLVGDDQWATTVFLMTMGRRAWKPVLWGEVFCDYYIYLIRIDLEIK